MSITIFTDFWRPYAALNMAMQEIRIPYTPRPIGRELHDNTALNRVIVAHRGFGKTFWAVNELIRAACSGPHYATYLYVMPKANQARRTVWDHVQRFVSKIPGHKCQNQSMTTTFPNGAKLLLLGSDDPESLRGLHVHGIVLDEVDDMSPMLWDIVAPTLTINNGFCVWIGTPKGRAELYKRYQMSQEPDRHDWYGVVLPWQKTNVISVEKIEARRSEMSPEMFNQEYGCDFDSALVGAYYGRQIAELRENGRIAYYDPPLYRADLETHVGFDLGIRDEMACFWYQLVGDDIHFVDFESHSNFGFPEWGKILENKATEYGYRYGDMVAPFDIKNRELGTGISRMESGAQYGLYFVACPMQDVADGIEMVRRTLPRCRFDLTRCADGIEALSAYRSKLDKDGHPIGPLHNWASHASDCCRYIITWIVQVVNQPAAMRVPLRRR